MKLVVILSSLKGNVKKIVDNLNLQSDCIIVNQCDENGEDFFKHGQHKIFLINSKTRGLSISRNIGIQKASDLGYDIGVLSDDDVTYYNGYHHFISFMYKNNPSVDVIGFNFDRYSSLSDCLNLRDFHELPNLKESPSQVKSIYIPHQYFPSVGISFKIDFVIDNTIKFNHNLGAGSGHISHGEDSYFIFTLRKCGANIKRSETSILMVDTKESTWRNIPEKKLISDKGALWKLLSPHFFWFYGILLVLKIKSSELSFLKAYKYFLIGANSQKTKEL